MKFSFGEPHVWRQHALSLLATGRYNDALAVFKEVINLEPNESINCLLAARICYEHLDLPVEGTNFSIKAKEVELDHNSGLLGRCHLHMGIGYQLQSASLFLKHDKHFLSANALDNFRT